MLPSSGNPVDIAMRLGAGGVLEHPPVSGGAFPTAGALVSDGFETGNMTPEVNTIGFSWAANNATSIVTMNPQCGGLSAGDPTVIWNNGAICNGPITGRDWNAHTGDNSLRFRYGAGADMSEQRFSLSGYHRDVWLHYHIRVPVNFLHGSLNNKFLAIWVDTYDVPGDVTWQTRPDGAGGAVLVYQDGGVTSGETGATQFITVPDDRGKWMEVKVHYKSATSSTANDGVIELYRRWYGAANWELIHQKLSANTFDTSAATQGLHQGYLMGWANDPYVSDTEWLLDNFEIADSDLWS